MFEEDPTSVESSPKIMGVWRGVTPPPNLKYSRFHMAIEDFARAPAKKNLLQSSNHVRSAAFILRLSHQALSFRCLPHYLPWPRRWSKVKLHWLSIKRSFPAWQPVSFSQIKLQNFHIAGIYDVRWKLYYKTKSKQTFNPR